MLATIISCFDNYNIRGKFIEEVLCELGYETLYLCSDFNHSSKKKFNIDRENALLISVPEYKKNLSISRIRSYCVFSKKVVKKLNELKPDLIYAIIPPNLLTKKLAKYKNKNKNTKLFFDVFDMWPESMPISPLIKNTLVCWKNLRDKHLHCADNIITECDLYSKMLPSNLNYQTVYLCKNSRPIRYMGVNDTINFLYLGSINHIIDKDGIIRFLSKLNCKRKVCLHIIGRGESLQNFITLIEKANISCINHGVIYDEEKKDNIISQCHFGLNMYKKGLAIGLTMKSMDYFSRGLPLVNGNIADTSKIIDEYNCGYNVADKNIYDKIASLTNSDWQILKQNTLKAYKENFSEEVVKNILRGTIK